MSYVIRCTVQRSQLASIVGTCWLDRPYMPAHRGTHPMMGVVRQSTRTWCMKSLTPPQRLYLRHATLRLFTTNPNISENRWLILGRLTTKEDHSRRRIIVSLRHTQWRWTSCLNYTTTTTTTTNNNNNYYYYYNYNNNNYYYYYHMFDICSAYFNGFYYYNYKGDIILL